MLWLVAAWCGYYGYMHLVEGQANAYYLQHIASIWLIASIACGIGWGTLGALAHRAWWPPFVLIGAAILEAAIALSASGTRSSAVLASIELVVAASAALALNARRRSTIAPEMLGAKHG